MSTTTRTARATATEAAPIAPKKRLALPTYYWMVWPAVIAFLSCYLSMWGK